MSLTIKKTTFLLSLLLFLGPFLMTATVQARVFSKSMSGIWFTKSPATWIVQTEVGVFSGSNAMRWELEEDENGMISGFNIWSAPDGQNGPVMGAMCMVGARDGSSVIITEASVEDVLLPTFEFTCSRRGLVSRCLGAGLSDQPGVALRGRMYKVRNPSKYDKDLIGEDGTLGTLEEIASIRDFCSGASDSVLPSISVSGR